MRPRPPWPRPSNMRARAVRQPARAGAAQLHQCRWRHLTALSSGATPIPARSSRAAPTPTARICPSSASRRVSCCVCAFRCLRDDVRYVHDGDQLTGARRCHWSLLTGKIVRFTRDVNFETRTMETEVDVENKDLSIAPGMYANTMLRLAHVENVVTIPVEALVLNGQQQVVYVLDDSEPRSYSHRHRWASKDRNSLRSRAASSRRSRHHRRPGQVSGRRRGQPASSIQQAASETLQETGGMIDLKGEEQTRGQVASDAQMSIVPSPQSRARPNAGLSLAQRARAIRGGAH